MKTALVVSGGGSKGAWGAGVSEFLHEKLKKKYDIYLGTSTGGLISGLSAVRDFKRLKKAYTKINQENIFKVSPFHANGHVKVLQSLKRILSKQKALGDSSSLKDLIKQYFTKEDFEKTKKENIEFVSCVTCLTTRKTEYKSNFDYEYDDFCDWLWASCNQPGFMSILEKEGKEYVDGGVKVFAPIQEAINRGAHHIDIIFHRPVLTEHDTEWKSKSVFDVIWRVEQIFCEQISFDDLVIGRLLANEYNVTMDVYIISFELGNSLVFDKQQMLKWWKQGLKDAESGVAVRHYESHHISKKFVQVTKEKLNEPDILMRELVVEG